MPAIVPGGSMEGPQPAQVETPKHVLFTHKFLKPNTQIITNGKETVHCCECYLFESSVAIKKHVNEILVSPCDCYQELSWHLCNSHFAAFLSYEKKSSSIQPKLTPDTHCCECIQEIYPDLYPNGHPHPDIFVNTHCIKHTKPFTVCCVCSGEHAINPGHTCYPCSEHKDQLALPCSHPQISPETKMCFYCGEHVSTAYESEVLPQSLLKHCCTCHDIANGKALNVATGEIVNDHAHAKGYLKEYCSDHYPNKNTLFDEVKKKIKNLNLKLPTANNYKPQEFIPFIPETLLKNLDVTNKHSKLEAEEFPGIPNFSGIDYNGIAYIQVGDIVSVVLIKETKVKLLTANYPEATLECSIYKSYKIKPKKESENKDAMRMIQVDTHAETKM